jgi:hypothetical protein
MVVDVLLLAVRDLEDAVVGGAVQDYVVLVCQED